MDNETLEFIGDVDFILYKNKKPVFKDITSTDSITFLPQKIVYDSIVLSKFNYIDFGIHKKYMSEVVYMSKSILELDEVVLINDDSSPNVLGEKSRFVKKASRPFTIETDYGIIFHLNTIRAKKIERIIFFVDKVKYKTNYIIKFYSVEEIGDIMTFQKLRINEMIFQSPTLTIEKSTKNKIDVDLSQHNLSFHNKTILVSIELDKYYDEENNIINPEIKNRTNLKFQLSSKLNYYSKMVDSDSRKLSNELININLLINYDFATQFFKKPHKSILVSPAILLQVSQN